MNYVYVTPASITTPRGRAGTRLALLAAVALCAPGAPVLAQAQLPTLPQVSLDTTYLGPLGGATREVCQSGCQYSSIQSAIDAASRGDEIVIRAGETFEGPIVLRNKGAGTGWIYIRSSAIDQLPPPGTRVSPADAVNMPRIRLTSGQSGVRVVRTENNASFYRLVGLEITQTLYLTSTTEFGSSGASLDQLPSDIIVDRCYIHGWGQTSASGRRGITLGSKRTSVIESYITDYWQTNADSQGIFGFYGPGPYKIENNYIAAGSENIMFGGAVPSNPVTPSDIVIRRNHLHKPDHWLPTSPSYDGIDRSIKNNLEFKNAQRVLVEGNILENNAAQAQAGRMLLITPKTQGACESFTKTSDITVRFNKLVNSPAGINASGRDCCTELIPQPCDYTYMARAHRLHIHDNLFENITSKYLFLLQSGIESLIVDHNTGFSPDWYNLYLNSNPGSSNGSKPQLVDFEYRNNINDGSLKCDGGGQGTAGLDGCTTSWAFEKNALVGQSSSIFPAENFFPETINDVGFVDPDNGDFRLAAGSPYKNAGTDGEDLGADVDAIENLTSGVRSGTGDPPATSVSTVDGVRRTDTRD